MMENAQKMERLSQKVREIEATMVTRKQLAGILETIEILSDKEAVEKIRQGERDIEEGRVKEITSVKDLL